MKFKFDFKSNMPVLFPMVIFTLLFMNHVCLSQSKTKPNVIFIAVDDLRADLGSYGNEVVKSPNLDLLAEEGILFQNHYVNVPTCGASRQSLLTGMRPKTRMYLQNNITEKIISDKEENEMPETFIHHLKRNGYYTVGIGKISHSADGYLYGYTEQPSSKRELPHSWDELIFDSGQWQTGWNAFFGYANGKNRQSENYQVKPYEKAAVDDNGYVDGLTTQLALLKLKELKSGDDPFFLGIGFFKPHLPFNAPEKYWEMYDENKIPVSENPIVPKNVNRKSLHNSGEFNQYKLGEEKATLEKPVSEAYAKKLKHAYYASVSYIDAQIGIIMKEVENLNLDKNTIIVVWGDHGWHLGDQQLWGKHSIFENSLKSTLIIKIPGKNKPHKAQEIVETVDIYPTLMELCAVGIPNPMDGESFMQSINHSDFQSDNVAYGYFREGISLRTKRYRLTKYFREEKPFIELYDHKNDPLEAVNIAADHPQLVAELMPLLEKGNTGLYK